MSGNVLSCDGAETRVKIPKAVIDAWMPFNPFGVDSSAQQQLAGEVWRIQFADRFYAEDLTKNWTGSTMCVPGPIFWQDFL